MITLISGALYPDELWSLNNGGKWYRHSRCSYQGIILVIPNNPDNPYNNDNPDNSYIFIYFSFYVSFFIISQPSICRLTSRVKLTSLMNIAHVIFILMITLLTLLTVRSGTWRAVAPMTRSTIKCTWPINTASNSITRITRITLVLRLRSVVQLSSQSRKVKL